MKKIISIIFSASILAILVISPINTFAADLFPDNPEYAKYLECINPNNKVNTFCADLFINSLETVENKEEIAFLTNICSYFMLGGPHEMCTSKVERLSTDYKINKSESLCNSSDSEVNNRAFLNAYRNASATNKYSQKAEQDCIVDAETAKHYCGISTRKGTCLLENALRLNEPLVCENEACVAGVAIQNKDLSICEKSENKELCYYNFAINGSKKGLDYQMTYQACEKLIEMGNVFTPPKSGSYSDPGYRALNCIVNITENKDDTAVCDNFDERLKDRCIYKLTSTSLEEKRTEASKSFAEKVKNRESGFYYAYIIYGLLALVFGILYWRFKNLRSVIIFNLVILTLITIFGSSIKLEAYISWQRLSAAVAGSGWSFGDPTRILVDHSHFHGVWPWWMIVVYFNLSDLIFAFIPSVLMGALGHKKAAIAINITLMLFMTGFYILAQIGQGLAG